MGYERLISSTVGANRHTHTLKKADGLKYAQCKTKVY